MRGSSTHAGIVRHVRDIDAGAHVFTIAALFLREAIAATSIGSGAHAGGSSLRTSLRIASS
jgi:hypothetical protein